MIYIYTHGFRSSLNSQTYHRICDDVRIAPLQLCYDNGGLFMENLLSLGTQLQAHLQANAQAYPHTHAKRLDSKKAEAHSPKQPLSESSHLESAPESISESSPPFDFISHSLGAFYLWQLTLFAPSLVPHLPRPRRLILFNPVFEPLTQLQAYIDKPQPNYTTNKPFILSQKAWESYAKARLDEDLGDVELIVYLARGDERINHKMSRPYWEQHGRVIDCDGGHSIADFSPFRGEILG